MPIVVVDDSVTNLAVLRSISKRRYDGDCVTFSDTHEAIKWLTTGRAELVLLDYSMPGLNGVEFIYALRANPLHEKTPIIMVTSSTDDSLRRKAIKAGANDFLSKPLNALSFSTCLTKHLGGSERTLAST